MNKCEHGEKITAFCASDCCVWKQAGGCAVCLKKYHNHMGQMIFVPEEEVLAIVKKYTLDHNIKPKCRLLQQAIYNYFNLIKGEITNSIDAACKNIINQIGYPYLYTHNTLSTYKRLKNKQYRKLSQKEFKILYELSLKISEKDLAKEEAKIYATEMKITIDLLNNLETVVRSYENVIKVYNPGFAHDGSFIARVNEIVKTMGGDSSPTKTKRETEIAKEKEFSSTRGSEPGRVTPLFLPREQSADRQIVQKVERQLAERQSVELKLESRADKLKEKQKQVKANEAENINMKNSLIAGKPIHMRDVSLDKKIIREHKFGLAIDQKEKDAKEIIKEKAKDVSLPQSQHNRYPERQKSQKQIQFPPNSEKIENLKQQLNNKEMEINEKKKLLIDMMRLKEDSSKPTLERNYDSIQRKDSFKNRAKLQIETVFKKEEGVQIDSIDSSSASQDFEEQSSQKADKKIKNYAFTKLPVDENPISKKFEEREEVKKKLIVIPALTGLKDLQSKHMAQIDSPLYKKKNILSKFEEFKLKDSIVEKEDKIFQNNFSPFENKTSILKKNQEVLELKENQEKSLALLLKALSLKAEEAVTFLQSALKYADYNLSAAEYLSYLYLELNRPKDCLNLCNRMLQKIEKSHQPDDISLITINNKCAALNILGRYSESIVILERCLKYQEKDTLFKNLADAYFSIGIFQKAIYNYEKAIKTNENYDEGHYNMAVCLYIQQNFQYARLAIRKALDIQPKNESYIELEGHIESRASRAFNDFYNLIQLSQIQKLKHYKFD